MKDLFFYAVFIYGIRGGAEMKAVKTLLLGTAAGLVAVAGAQAADMPVKAKPVQYVKICSLYGDGFYYIPGTDTCLKMGGYMRV
jgi:Porin subfamily